MKWLIAAPFIKDAQDHWLGDFVPGQRHAFEAIPASYEHDRSRAKTTRSEWVDYFKHAWKVVKRVPRARGTGVITCFPQLPVAVGLLSIITGKRFPIVAWTFNVGKLPGGIKRKISAIALHRVDLIVVHSRNEIEECIACFGLPRDRLLYVPLQRALKPRPRSENMQEPFLLALGTANRDYRLLFQVLSRHPRRTIVVAGTHALAGLDVPPCVEVRSGLSIDACHELVLSARINVIPVANATTASGQVTLLDSMGMGCPTIITRCPGSEDYVQDGVTAVLVEPQSADDLLHAIATLWDDVELRARVSSSGAAHVKAQFSDEAIGAQLGRICDRYAADNGVVT
jgi:hypothetical protein